MGYLHVTECTSPASDLEMFEQKQPTISYGERKDVRPVTTSSGTEVKSILFSSISKMNSRDLAVVFDVNRFFLNFPFRRSCVTPDSSLGSLPQTFVSPTKRNVFRSSFLRSVRGTFLFWNWKTSRPVVV
ncbi:hypothetical protein CDAR_527481 [Caerostris darwini]|uniref:Uncharacterized protein n=1 Tax=Caerostris darwini TaxID=1538125 RepID=A0AAV4WLX7_9ARAC|nr:hypothetical protein CDAR_527481 [Caerostris darwini]